MLSFEQQWKDVLQFGVNSVPWHVLFVNTIFWDVPSCSLVEIYRRFKGTHSWHLQILSSEDGNKRLLRNVNFLPRYTSSHHKTTHLHTTKIATVKTSNPVCSWLFCIFDESWCHFMTGKNLLLTKMIISTDMRYEGLILVIELWHYAFQRTCTKISCITFQKTITWYTCYFTQEYQRLLYSISLHIHQCWKCLLQRL